MVLVDTVGVVDLALCHMPCADEAASSINTLEHGAAAIRRFIDDRMQDIDVAFPIAVHLAMRAVVCHALTTPTPPPHTPRSPGPA
jgi:hypothetical protein